MAALSPDRPSGPSLWETPDLEKRGRYEILRVVNRGGMGEIALGRARGTRGFEKLVILKRLRADAEREDHIAMFDVEQEVMSRIEHPNIVKVFDQPVIDGVPYLAMEYVRGRNLDQIIRAAQNVHQEVTLQFSLSVISEVLRGLAFVHRLKDEDGRALGVVHQDMTPSNVMVSFFGEVKITDFGISYVTSRDGGLRKGVLKGKPRYVAPEVLAGKRVNNTADIYGVGVVFYELLTGRALFARPTVKETLAAVAKNELPDFAQELGHQGEGTIRLLERALKKDPQERYRTAEAMAAEVLNELAKRGGPLAPATLGYEVRRLFREDPDVPEMDPTFEQALVKSPPSGGLVPADLDETLKELDRLLGTDRSTDLFAVPPELQSELKDLEDMDPFMALTPIPDFVWSAKDDADLLARAGELYAPSSTLREPPPMFARREATPTLPPRDPESEEEVAILPPEESPEQHPAPATVEAPRALPPFPDGAQRVPRPPPEVLALPSSSEPKAPAIELRPTPRPNLADDLELRPPVVTPPRQPPPARAPTPRPVMSATLVEPAIADAQTLESAVPVLRDPRVHPSHERSFWAGLALGFFIGLVLGVLLVFGLVG